MKAIEKGYASVGVTTKPLPGSTDASIPIPQRFPPRPWVCPQVAGSTRSEEFLDSESLILGANALLEAVISFQESAV